MAQLQQHYPDCERKHKPMFWAIGLVGTVVMALIALTVSAIGAANEATAAASEARAAIRESDARWSEFKQHVIGSLDEIKRELRDSRGRGEPKQN